MSDSLVSVIVPVWQVEPYLDKCVRSIVDQTYSNLEIILVDDGSPDNCPAMCDAWAEKDRRIRVIHKANGGISDARNAGLNIASGDYIVFVDSDDYVHHSLIELMLAHNSSDTISLCLCQRVTTDETVSQCKTQSGTKTVLIRNLKDFVGIRDGLFCWGIMFSKELIDRIPTVRFDTNLNNLEDCFWMSIILTRVKKTIVINEEKPMYYYLDRGNSITSKSVDRRWQASSWIKVLNSLTDYLDIQRKNLDSNGRKIIKQAIVHAKKNFYSECYSANMSVRTVTDLCGRSTAEAIAYREALFLKDGLQKLYKLLPNR